MDNLTKMLIKKATPDIIADGVWKDVATEIGMNAFCTLLYYAGGLQLYIPRLDKILIPVRDNAIKEEFDGFNYEYLAKKYNLTERTVRKLVLN
ncbi:MAG: Mor transcription activator family protein [Candidatus Fimenecus sp.]